VGEAGLTLLPAGGTEVLARPCCFVHEGALRHQPEDHTLRFELGFVPFTLNRPDIWQAVAFAARIEGGLPALFAPSLASGIC
jgi:hypothetical protein